MKVSLLVVAFLISLSSCTTIEYIPVDLSGKIPPPLRDLTEKELECISDETYKRIVKGELRIETLTRILKSTSE